MKREKKLIFVLLIMSLTYSLQAQTTIEEIVGIPPSIDSTYNEIKDIYGIDSSPNAQNFVSDISSIANRGIITIKWKGIVDPNVVYYVYRYNSPIINSALLAQAKQVAEARPSDSLSVDYSINDIPDNTGNYYYAVVADVNGIAKFFTATANVDMTSTPIVVNRINGEFVSAGFNPNDLNGRYATSIKVSAQSESNTMVYWQEIPGYKGQYTIYRNSFPIEGDTVLRNSVVVGRTIDVFFNDVNPLENGAYYYVDSDYSRGRVFIKNENFSTEPALYISPAITKKTELRVDNLNAIADQNGITLEWTLINSTTNNYKYLVMVSTNAFTLGLNAFYNDGIISIKKINKNEIMGSDRIQRYLDNTSSALHNNKPIYFALSIVFDDTTTLPEIKEGMFTRYPVKPIKVDEQIQIPPLSNIVNTPITNIVNAPITNVASIPITNVDNNAINTNQAITFPINKNETNNNATPPIMETDRTDFSKKSSSAKEIDKEYQKAIILFRDKKYKDASVTLEDLVIDEKQYKGRYFNVNLLLGRCYYKLGQKKKALNIFRAIYDYSPQEVSFWVSQVLSDL